jgi:hypothetical protein
MANQSVSIKGYENNAGLRKSSHGNVSSIGSSNVFKKLRSGTGHGISGER